MSKFFTENEEIRNEFDKLSVAVKNAVIESGIEINSVEQLKEVVHGIEENM